MAFGLVLLTETEEMDSNGPWHHRLALSGFGGCIRILGGPLIHAKRTQLDPFG